MSKNLSAKYYQENKERLQKKSRERYQNPSKEEKEKSDITVASVTKIFQKNKLVEYKKKNHRIRESALL